MVPAPEWIGVTDIVYDPRDPDVMYAATWQRHRNVASYLGGGPGSGIHKSTDGGETWTESKKGIPGSNLGKIGLAISPQKPDVIYAAIELDRRTGAVYRSDNRGSSWKKQSKTVAGGTGPHYYQELYANPHQYDRIYLVDVRMQVSEDGGKTFQRVKDKYKHVDHHALVFRADDPDYLLTGTDGGLYESFDLAENWRHISNLPVTQFYKVAVDDAEPFYNVYGGTQDNNTQGGPSRTDNRHGIRNADWYITMSGDGHQPATEPGNPDIIYSQSQQGNLHRVDRATGDLGCDGVATARIGRDVGDVDLEERAGLIDGQFVLSQRIGDLARVAGTPLLSCDPLSARHTGCFSGEAARFCLSLHSRFPTVRGLMQPR